MYENAAWPGQPGQLGQPPSGGWGPQPFTPPARAPHSGVAVAALIVAIIALVGVALIGALLAFTTSCPAPERP